MTDREEDREAFLVRWSRRKREAAANRAQPPAEPPAIPEAAGEPESAPPQRSAVPPPSARPESELPPIESIDAATDIRGFLKEGVPQDLARAALRRAWRSDPAIRDFVGLSENAWDFTAPAGVPGFGPFAPDAAQQLVAQVLGARQPDSSAEPSAAAVAEPDRSAKGGEPEHEVVKPGEIGPREAQPAGGVGAREEPAPSQKHSAMQQQAAKPEPSSRGSRSS